MKFNAHKILVAFAVIALMSCSGENIKTTFIKMRQYACNSNTQEFFQHIDKQAVRGRFAQSTIDRFTQGASEDKLSERSQGMSPNLKNKYVSEHINTLWSKYENWIDLGKDGPLCKMEILKSEDAMITIHIPGEPDEVWGFYKSNTRWKVVSIQ